MYMIEEIQKQLKESKKRWKEIDRLTKKVKNTTNSTDERIANISKLVLLLAEQLRPMNPEHFKGQFDQMIDIFGGKNDKS